MVVHEFILFETQPRRATMLNIYLNGSCHMCHRVVHFVQTVEHGEGTRRGVERSVNTLEACYRPARPSESFGHTQTFRRVGTSGGHTVITRYEHGKRTGGRYEVVMDPFVGGANGDYV